MPKLEDFSPKRLYLDFMMHSVKSAAWVRQHFIADNGYTVVGEEPDWESEDLFGVLIVDSDAETVTYDERGMSEAVQREIVTGLMAMEEQKGEDDE